MTNKEKAYQLYNELSRKWSSLHYGHTINTLVEMAEWKDQQFREYLEKKKAEHKEGQIGYYIFTDIINELFKKD